MKYIFGEGYRHQHFIHLIPRKILCKIDPNFTCQFFLKNGYQTPNTPRKHLDHSKNKKK